MNAAHRDFSGRVAVVTGGSGGIGTELCLRLADAGAAVAVHYARDRESAEAVAARIVAASGRAIALAADLRDAAAPDRLVANVEAELGSIAILVANAGLSRPGS